jgi:hypothetical protein
MKSTAVLVLAALTAMAAAPAPQPPQPVRQTPSSSQRLIAPYNEPGSVSPTPDRPYLFKLGSVPARLWAPVPAPYDSHANRNNNANPSGWETAGF